MAYTHIYMFDVYMLTLNVDEYYICLKYVKFFRDPPRFRHCPTIRFDPSSFLFRNTYIHETILTYLHYWSNIAVLSFFDRRNSSECWDVSKKNARLTIEIY